MAVNSLKLTICSTDILILNPSNGIWSTALETCFEQQIWNISPCASMGSKVLTKSLTNSWETDTVEMDPNYLDLYWGQFIDFLFILTKIIALILRFIDFLYYWLIYLHSIVFRYFLFLFAGVMWVIRLFLWFPMFSICLSLYWFSIRSPCNQV